jgi:hypothetical protein
MKAVVIWIARRVLTVFVAITIVPLQILGAIFAPSILIFYLMNVVNILIKLNEKESIQQANNKEAQ